MRILFVFKNENFLAPIGLCAIAAIAKQQGHKTYISEINSHKPFEFIEKLKPDVVAYSSSTGEAKHYLRFNHLLKEKFPDIFTIMGGPHPTFYPDVIYRDSLDAICIGEGDSAFAELLQVLDANTTLEGIPNILTKKSREKTIIRNLVEEIDSLPVPDYALLYDNTSMGKYPLKSFITSRGCPYDCSYCFNHEWRKLYYGKGRAVRRHSVDYVIDEIIHVKAKWPLSCIKFYDDIFVYSADEWLEKFSLKYKKHIKLPFFILTRADLLNEDMVRLLKNAGCRTISMSIEAGNAGIRNNMLKRHMSNEQIINAHHLCQRYGIYTFTNCIMGLPETSIDNDVESLNLAIKAKATWAEFPIFHAYPGTELGEYAIEKRFYKPNFEDMHTSYQYKSPLNCFDERTKNAQMNLGLLGPVAVVFPALRNIVASTLIFIKHNFLFTFIYYLVKMYVVRKKIYVTDTNFLTSSCIFIKSLKQEWFRHENKTG